MGISTKKTPVLLVNPPSGTLPYALPMGAVDLMNRLSVPKAGVFARDATSAGLSSALVAAIPVHWFYSMGPAVEIARKIKSISPETKVIAGGYSATLFDEDLAASGVFDAIIRGDAEKPFPLLVSALLSGKPIDGIPNLTFPGGRTPTGFAVDEEELARADYKTIDWFPALKNAALNLQKCGEVSYLYPWIPVSRGCLYNCDNCLATASAQRRLFGRNPVFRPPWAVSADLDFFSREKNIRYAHINTDFISMLGPEKAAGYFSGGPFDLTCYYEWYRHPSREALGLLSGAFKKVVSAFFFSLEGQCANSGGLHAKGAPESLYRAVSLARQMKNVTVMIYIDPAKAAADPQYAKGVHALSKNGGVVLRRIEGDLFPRVGSLDPAGVEYLRLTLAAKAAAELPGMERRHRVFAPLMARRPKIFEALLKASSAGLAVETALRARRRR